MGFVVGAEGFADDVAIGPAAGREGPPISGAVVCSLGCVETVGFIAGVSDAGLSWATVGVVVVVVVVGGPGGFAGDWIGPTAPDPFTEPGLRATLGCGGFPALPLVASAGRVAAAPGAFSLGGEPPGVTPSEDW